MTPSVNLGGAVLPKSVASDLFYGFRIDPETGNLFIDEIINGSGVISLPQDNGVDAKAYKQWLWTQNKVVFNFNSSNGHLEMTVL